jgi:hypothetical protein
VHWTPGLPHLSLLRWGHWLWFHIPAHGAPLSRLWQEEQAWVLHLPCTPGNSHNNTYSTSYLFPREQSCVWPYKGVSRRFQTGCLEQELQMVQLSATRCSCIAIMWASLVSFSTKTLCVACQWVFIVAIVVCLIIDSIRKLLDTPFYLLNGIQKKS